MSDKEIIVKQSKDILHQSGVDLVLPTVNHAQAKLNQILNQMPLPLAVVNKVSKFEKSITDKITIPKLREVFNVPHSVKIIDAISFPKFPSSIGKDSELGYKSSLGTPVYTNIEFLPGQYETNKPGVFKQFGPLRYEAILITVNQGKRIVKTEIQGRNGTVKEYIGDDDYQVNISGVLTAPNGVSPADQIIELKKILDAPVPLQVASSYLQHLGIFNLVISGYELGQQAGGYSYQQFTINCISDEPQELRITNV